MTSFGSDDISVEGGGGKNHHAGGVEEDQRGGVMTGVAEDMKAG